MEMVFSQGLVKKAFILEEMEEQCACVIEFNYSPYLRIYFVFVHDSKIVCFNFKHKSSKRLYIFIFLLYGQKI